MSCSIHVHVIMQDIYVLFNANTSAGT